MNQQNHIFSYIRVQACSSTAIKTLFTSQTTDPGCCLPSSQSKRKESKCVIKLRTHRWLCITTSPCRCNEDRIWTRQKCLACSPSDRPLLNNQTWISFVHDCFGSYSRNPGQGFYLHSRFRKSRPVLWVIAALS